MVAPKHPSPPCPSTGRGLVHGGERAGGNTWYPCLDRPVLQHGTYHGTHVADIIQLSFMTTKGYPTGHAHPTTQEHMESRLHPHFHTHMDPSCSLHNATNHLLCWMGAMVPKQGPNVRRHGVAVFGQAPCWAINRRWSPPSKIALTSTTVLRVSTRHTLCVQFSTAPATDRSCGPERHR